MAEKLWREKNIFRIFERLKLGDFNLKCMT